jgi:hypothetical protein
LISLYNIYLQTFYSGSSQNLSQWASPNYIWRDSKCCPNQLISCGEINPMPDLKNSCGDINPMPDLKNSCGEINPMPDLKNSCGEINLMLNLKNNCREINPMPDLKNSCGEINPMPNLKNSCGKINPVPNLKNSWRDYFKSSPLLELYTRVFLALLKCFDIIQQRYFTFVKCHELELQLKRNQLRKHDYMAYITQVNGALPVIISPVHMTLILLVYHIAAFKYIEYYVIAPNYSWNFNIANEYINLANPDTNIQIENIKLICQPEKIVGGGTSKIFTAEELHPVVENCVITSKFKFLSYLNKSDASRFQTTHLLGNIPLTTLMLRLTIADLKVIAKCHKINVHSKIKLQEIQNVLGNHICNDCEEYVSVFEILCNDDLDDKKKVLNLQAVKKSQAKNPDYKASNLQAVKKNQASNPDYKAAHLQAVKKNQANNPDYKVSNLQAVKKSQVNNPDYKAFNLQTVKKSQANNPDYKASNLQAVKKSRANNPEKARQANLSSVRKYQEKISTSFPSAAPSEKLQHTIIFNWCKDTAPSQFMESGCIVCGKLTPILELKKLSKTNLDLDVLIQSGMSQKERTCSEDPIVDIEGPVLDKKLDSICKSCSKSISQGKVPLMALANGKWLGEVPIQLQNLSFAEQLLVARVRHNRCLVKVSSGMYKMKANAISFANPMPKIYNILPPPIDEMDDVLAFIYTGPCMPTKLQVLNNVKRDLFFNPGTAKKFSVTAFMCLFFPR